MEYRGRKSINLWPDSGSWMLFLVFWALFLVVPPISAEPREVAADNEVLAVGTATVYEGNVASAKDRAITSALKRAVEAYLLRHLGSRQVAENFERLGREVIPGSEGQIENFHILAESEIDDSYRVLVRARVSEELVEQRLRQSGVRLEVERPPVRILFLVYETRHGKTSWWWQDPARHSSLTPTEVALYRIFEKRGFIPINRTMTIPEQGMSNRLRSLNLEAEEAIRWGELTEADVVIYGGSEIVQGSEIYMTLSGVNVAEQSQIGKVSRVEPIEDGQGLMEALGTLADGLAARMAPAITRSVTARRSGNQLEVLLKGLGSYREFRVLRDFLRRDVSGIESVRQTRVRKDSITIVIQYQGDKNRLLDRILNHEKLPFPLEVNYTKEDRIIFISGKDATGTPPTTKPSS